MDFCLFLLFTLLLSGVTSKDIKLNSLTKLNGKDCPSTEQLVCSSSHSNHGSMMMAFMLTNATNFQVSSSWTSQDNFELQLVLNTNGTCSTSSNSFDQILVSQSVQGSGIFGPFAYTSNNMLFSCVKVVLVCKRPLWFGCNLDNFVTTANINPVNVGWCYMYFGMNNAWSTYC